MCYFIRKVVYRDWNSLLAPTGYGPPTKPKASKESDRRAERDNRRLRGRRRPSNAECSTTGDRQREAEPGTCEYEQPYQARAEKNHDVESR